MCIRDSDALYVAAQTPGGDGRIWSARQGWSGERATGKSGGEEQAEVKYEAFTERELTLEPATYFKTDEPNPDLMTYGQLSRFIDRMNASGANVVPQRVALARKIAFPFVTVIMTILAVPFAVSTGRHGAMYG